MAQFLVLVDAEPDGWRVDRDALTVAIRDRWADVGIDSTRYSKARSFCWSFATGNGPGEAYLHEDGTCLYVDALLEDAAQLAISFRRLTPPDVDVVFCDEGYTFDIRLRPGVTDGDLADLVNSA
ncbi:hypothetical protein [Streptomyces sp. NPDC059063]|uniref:hypothetical protein n=1 Tax=unclassified Streptomyces TaxID=2593676 RepID=UPI0036C44226